MDAEATCSKWDKIRRLGYNKKTWICIYLMKIQMLQLGDINLISKHIQIFVNTTVSQIMPLKTFTISEFSREKQFDW